MALTEDISVYSVVQPILWTIPWANPAHVIRKHDAAHDSEAWCCSRQRPSFTGQGVGVAIWKLQHYPGLAQPYKVILILSVTFSHPGMPSSESIFFLKRWEAYFKVSTFHRCSPASFLQRVLIFFPYELALYFLSPILSFSVLSSCVDASVTLACLRPADPNNTEAAALPASCLAHCRNQTRHLSCS